MKNLDKWIIFGCSPFINKIDKHIENLQNKYICIGLNLFPVNYLNVDYWAFVDYNIFKNIVINNYHNQKLIVPDYIYKNEISKLSNIKPHYIFKTVNEIQTEQNNTLFGRRSVATWAINFAIINKVVEIYLIGIDYNQNWKHYYCDKTSEISQNFREKLKKDLNLFKDYVKLYKVNPESDFILPLRTVEQLLN